MKREPALIRWRRWAAAAKTRQGERGLKLFVGSAKQMVQVPAGKRLLWALCLSNIWTQYKKGKGRWGRRGPSRQHRGLRGPTRTPAGSPQQRWSCQRMSVIRRLTEVIPRLSPALQQAVPLSATLKEGKGGEAARHGGGGVLSQLGLMKAPRLCPKITIALFWSFVVSCWQWLLTKRLDMERIWPLTLPSSFLSLRAEAFSLGGWQQQRKQVWGLHVALFLKGIWWGLCRQEKQVRVEVLVQQKQKTWRKKSKKKKNRPPDFFFSQFLLSNRCQGRWWWISRKWAKKKKWDSIL